MHDFPEPPSPWLLEHAAHIRPHGIVLDLACGRGRNTRWLAQQGFHVVAVDRDQAALRGLRGVAGIEVTEADLEQGPWPYPGRTFDAIVVCRYLHRPLLPRLADALSDGGVLIYETFMSGQARFGRPSNPHFLLLPDELLHAFGARFSVIAFEQGEFHEPQPAMLQRMCAKNTVTI